MNAAHEEFPVTATLVDDDARLDFLPHYFGPRLMLRAENLVYEWMYRLSPNYNGGYWHFYTLSNGGFYLAPLLYGEMLLIVPGNVFSDTVSPDAAGIVATLFTLCQIIGEAHQKGMDVAPLLERYHALRDFAAEHAEAAAIYRAID